MSVPEAHQLCLEELTWSDNDNTMYLGQVAAIKQVPFTLRQPGSGKDKRGGEIQPCPPSRSSLKDPEHEVLTQDFHHNDYHCG